MTLPQDMDDRELLDALGAAKQEVLALEDLLVGFDGTPLTLWLREKAAEHAVAMARFEAAKAEVSRRLSVYLDTAAAVELDGVLEGILDGEP